MEKVKATLIKAIGETAAGDFIKASMEVDDVQIIKKRVCSLLDTRKLENRQVYEILIEEKLRRSGFEGEGYRKSKSNPNGPSDLSELTTNIKTSADKNSKNICNQGKKKQKTKFYPLFTEGAQTDQLVSLLPGRHPCQCLATKHQLVNNCIHCGRIVCAQEGSGPCYFCGNLVCTREELEQISLGTKQSEKLRNRLLQANWAPGTEDPPYRVKRQALKAAKSGQKQINLTDELRSDSSPELKSDEEMIIDTKPLTGAQERLEDGIVAALANRDKLLEFDATCARRTRVIDDELDYFMTEGGGGNVAWLSSDVRERIRRRVAELRAQRHAGRFNTSRFCYDFATKSVIQEDTRDEAAKQLYQPEEELLDELYKSSNSTNSGLSNGTNEPRLADPTKGMVLPIFEVPSSKDKQNIKIDPKNPLIQALKQPLSDLRIQDDESKQLIDEGYCLSLHQPWASLLVRGIKRDEGRTWYTPHRGCLWIASTSKNPDADEIKEIEQNYITSGVPKSDLPSSYPVGCLLGRVNVVTVLAQEEYREKYPDGASNSPYVLICDNPRELLFCFPIRGQHKIYKLDKQTHANAKKNLAL